MVLHTTVNLLIALRRMRARERERTTKTNQGQAFSMEAIEGQRSDNKTEAN